MSSFPYSWQYLFLWLDQEPCGSSKSFLILLYFVSHIQHLRKSPEEILENSVIFYAMIKLPFKSSHFSFKNLETWSLANPLYFPRSKSWYYDFIIRNTSLISVPISGRAPSTRKFLNTKSQESVFCHVNEVTFKPNLNLGTGCQGTNMEIRKWRLELSPTPRFPRRQGAWRLNQSPIANDLIN